MLTLNNQSTTQIAFFKIISIVRLSNLSATITFDSITFESVSFDLDFVFINLLIKTRDVYNIKTQIRRDELELMTSIQTLMHQLNENDWTYAFQKDRLNQVIHFFFAKKSSQSILKINYEVFIMNCIYKINRYKMSLMIIFDQIVLHKTFYVVFCFMTKKKQNDYVWVLQQLKLLYQKLKLFDLTIFIIDMKKDNFSISRSYWLTDLKKNWWMIAFWFFQLRIIYYARDTSTITSWSTVKRAFSLKKHERNSFLSEKWWCMLHLSENIYSCEMNFSIDTILRTKNVWNICMTFTSEIIVIASWNATSIRFCISISLWRREMKKHMQCWRDSSNHSLKIWKQWWMRLIYYWSMSSITIWSTSMTRNCAISSSCENLFSIN